MRNSGAPILLCLCLGLTAFGAEPSADLRALAKPLVADESRYGCGPLRKPGQTFHVSARGDDKADGRSWKTAWRTVRRGVSALRAGDTLLVDEGEYVEQEIQVNVFGRQAPKGATPRKQNGEPGRPIRIMAAPGRRVILTGARLIDAFTKTPGRRFTWEAPLRARTLFSLWESDTQIMLQPAGAVDRVDDLPATYWHDKEAKKIYVRFSDSRGPEVHGIRVRGPRVGLRIHGAYVLVRGIVFRNYGSAVMVRPNKDVKGVRSDGHHVTVERCGFFANDMAGVHFCVGPTRCLVRDNYGRQNGRRGTILFQNAETRDNLFIRNRADSSKPTIREHGQSLHYGINNYGGAGARNHVLDNVLNDTRGFRWKPYCKASVFQGNVVTGSFYCTGTKRAIKNVADRVVLRNNVMLGPIYWYRELPTDGAGADLARTDKALVSNFGGYRKPGKVKAARFADPAYLDYRLQADSPLRGSGVAGRDRGLTPRGKGRVLFVSPKGDDAASGLSERQAFRTLKRAAKALRPGDTLYLAPGAYTEPLALTASGTAGSPVVIRAHGRKRVRVPSMDITGNHVRVEGLAVAKATGDGVTVSGRNVTLKRCRVSGCKGAGVAATGAGLSLLHCTLARNDVGLRLGAGATEAEMRDSVIASGRTAALRGNAGGLRASDNVYFGAGLDKARIDKEPRSIVADPLFTNAEKGDYRLRWDSPAARLGLYATAAGAAPALAREPRIDDVDIVNVTRDSAVVVWRTPLDDTNGWVSCCPKGVRRYRSEQSPAQGTRHSVGLVNLKPKTTYSIRLRAAGRRGGSATWRGEFMTTDGPAPPRVFHLSPQGDDAKDGLSPGSAWRSIRRANEMVGPGDTVLIAPGVYHDAIAPRRGGEPDRRIVFERSGEGAAVIDAGGFVAPLVNLRRKSHITIDGLSFDNLPHYGGTGGVFRIGGNKDIEILNCRAGVAKPVSWRSGNFVSGGPCDGLRIEGNVSWGTSYHIWLGSCSNVAIRNNTFVESTMIAVILQGRGKGFTIENNLWYRPCIPGKSNQCLMLRAAQLQDIRSDYNLFFSPCTNHKVAVRLNARYEPTAKGDTLAEWKKTSGLDAHSLQADPRFADVKKGDFRLLPGSPALGAGRGGKNIGACGGVK